MEQEEEPVTLSIAFRNMRSGKARIAFSVAGVAVATLLLSFILALYRGWNERIASYIDDTGADIWVAPFGSESFFTPGIVTRSVLPMIQAVPGITQADPLLYRPVKLEHGSGAWDTWVIGFEPGKLGGPTGMESGSATPGRGEIILDTVLAKLAGVDIGDTVSVGGNALRVSGISTGGNVVFAQLAFVSAEESQAEMAKSLTEANLPEIPASLQPGNSINLALIKTEPGKAAEVTAAINKNVPGIRAFQTAAFAENSRKPLEQAMVPILLIILCLAFLVGTLVLGLTVYTSVLEKEREFGVIKALGTPGPGLLRVVFEQALFCCLAGFVVGELGVFAAAWITSLAVPQMVTLIKPLDLGIVLAGALIMSLLASFVPAGRIMRVNTLSVFKA
jgi:putative ABC transport system permease protein